MLSEPSISSLSSFKVLHDGDMTAKWHRSLATLLLHRNINKTQPLSYLRWVVEQSYWVKSLQSHITSNQASVICRPLLICVRVLIVVQVGPQLLGDRLAFTRRPLPSPCNCQLLPTNWDCCMISFWLPSLVTSTTSNQSPNAKKLNAITGKPLIFPGCMEMSVLVLLQCDWMKATLSVGVLRFKNQTSTLKTTWK